MRLLIDECLSPKLAKHAIERGFESSHVVWLGRNGWQDWSLKTFVVDGDWTFVTRNAVDFRGPLDAPGTKGQYADLPLHAGLICLNGPVGLGYEGTRELFDLALDLVDENRDLTNEVIDVTLSAGAIRVRRYRLPRENGEQA